MHINMSYEERQARQERNERRILNFIASEGFSTAQMLAELLGYQHPQSVYKILRRLEEKKVIRAYKMAFIGNLYLLTPTGIGQLDEGVEVKNIKANEIKPFSMAHRLAIQKCHIAMIKNQVRWDTSTGKIKKGLQKPDGVVWFSFHKEEKSEIAIEVELTMKTRKRYFEIYGAYARSKYPAVVYLVPNETMKKRLKSMLEDISKQHPHGKNYQLNNMTMQVFTLEGFASTFTAEYSDKRSAENKIMIDKNKEKQAIEKSSRQEEAAEKVRAEREEQERINRKYEEERQALFPESTPKKKKWGIF